MFLALISERAVQRRRLPGWPTVHRLSEPQTFARNGISVPFVIFPSECGHAVTREAAVLPTMAGSAELDSLSLAA